MPDATSGDQPLPPLREDLDISPGAPLLSGAPSWVIYDPVRHRFFQVGQRTVEIISRWSAGTVENLRSDLLAKRALSVGEAEVTNLLGFLKQHDLLALNAPGTARRMVNAETRQRTTWLQWAMHRYIFFRVPLVRPNRFLHATWPLVRPFFSRQFVWFTVCLLVLAAYLTSRQFTDLILHFRDVFSKTGALTYIGAVIFVKILHEFGHAYQAISRGLRVQVMGVAFLVMFPLLYTDVTDAWRLRSRRDRIMVDSGGVLVEMTVAVFATLLWCFLPDGTLRSAAFAVATTGWFFSLLINLNPLMRFDGYYLLADAIGVQNLQPRSFAVGKWALRELMFNLGDPPPERLAPGMQRFMVLYAVAVAIYRFFLFIAIALLVYAFFFKALAIILFIIEIAFFVVRPILKELGVWFVMRDRIIRKTRSWVSLALLIGIVTAMFWPVSTRIYAPAILEEARQQSIFAEAEGQLQKVFVKEGQTVRAGDPLFQLVDPELPLKLQQSERRMEMYRARLLSGAGDEVERAERLIVNRLLEEEQQTSSALKDKNAALLIRAAHDGFFTDLPPQVQPGTWLARTQFLGRIIDPGAYVINGFINETDLERYDPAKQGQFVADELAVPRVKVEQLAVSDFSVQELPDGYLAAPNGGGISVLTTDNTGRQPKGVWYPVSTETGLHRIIAFDDLQTAQRGYFQLHSKPESYAKRIWRRIAQVLIREVDL
ncbi:hypothetical protein ACXYMO_14500 [Arenibacterium sp. CAU 1754]